MAGGSPSKQDPIDDPLDAPGDPAADDPRGITGIVRGAKLEPIRYVERELTRPDGSKLCVKVPVYPPFRLEERPSAKSTPEAPKRSLARRKAS